MRLRHMKARICIRAMMTNLRVGRWCALFLFVALGGGCGAGGGDVPETRYFVIDYTVTHAATSYSTAEALGYVPYCSRGYIMVLLGVKFHRMLPL